MPEITNNPSNALDEHINVTDQTLPDMVFALGRVLMVLVGLGSGILALLKNRDIAGLVAFVKENDVVTLVSTAAGLAALIYGQFKTWRNKRKLITTAAAAPNSIATVTKT